MASPGRGEGGGVWHRQVLPLLALVTTETTNVALNTLFKFATRKGMSRYVFIVYAYGVAAIVLLPSPFFSPRSTALPPLNLSILSKVFLLGVVGYSSQLMGYTGISFASPTLASAMSNLAPAFTFLLALLFRMERVEFSRIGTKEKIIGAVVSITGAFVVTFYKGPRLGSSSLHQSSQSNWIIGSLFLTVEYLLVPVWYILQAHIMKEYPSELTLVFFYTACVSILGALVAIFADPNSATWRFMPTITIASILSSGVFGSCLNNIVHTWAIHLRGPVYVAMFKPLSIVIAAFMGVVFLGDTLHLGSIIGAATIVIGFYTVMLGKAKEDDSLDSDLDNNAQKSPLLVS